MQFFNWFAASKCQSCPSSSTCTDHEKEQCPGPVAPSVPVFVSPQPARTRVNLETLEAREVFSVNPIVAENALPGNPQAEWDVTGTGDSSIEGFATDISVDQGQTVSFKVNDKSLAPYHIDIYRMGYYGGLGARKVGTIGSAQTIKKVQPNPLTDAATKLVDAGNWSVTASWTVPTTAVSGVYLAKLVREDTGGASHMVFVVRDDDGQSDLLFQTSDETWEAYNNWGGNSLYDYNSTNGMRAYAVSYNRPLVTRNNGVSDPESPFWSEMPMIRWLESNGYNVSYTTGVDGARRGSEILEHKVFMSVGHDEYWSGEQRAAVEAARDAGVNLAFFSGNEMYWKTRWTTSLDSSATPYRTLVSYKESTVRNGTDPTLPPGVSSFAYVSGVEDPTSTWTGIWRDLRGSDAKVEQLLTGQLFSVNRGSGGLAGTAIQVPAEYSLMRLWRNTSIASLQPGQIATLAQGTLGYEWDEDSDSGFRAPGTINMSSTTEAVPEKLVDPVSWPGCGGLPSSICSRCRGCLVAQGSATHTLTEYRAASGALVFGAGTIQWSWGLDGFHDGGTSTPDVRMQQATVNLFADMGVSAGSLAAGLVQTTKSTDLTKPTSTITSPGNGTSFLAGVATTITGTATDGGGGVVGGVEVSFDGGQTWHKATGRNSWSYTWTPDKTGTAVILSRAADDSGNMEVPGAGATVSVNLATTSTTGLVASYNFDSVTNNTVADVSGHGNTGTASNTTLSSSGRYGSALLFNGTNSWVTVADANSLDLTTAMTLEAWVKPSSTTSYGSVLTKETSSGLAYSLYGTDPTGHPSGWVHIGSDLDATSTTAMSANTWNHLAATYDGSTLSMYLNGTLVSSRALSGSIATSNGVLRIGGNAFWGDYFNGLIDDVRVYNRALTQGEILADLSTPVGGTMDATAPTVSLSNTGGTVSGMVTLTATASDNVAVGGVQYLLNGQPLGPELTAPYTYAWNTMTLPNGSYTIQVRVRDLAGNTSLTTATAFTVSNNDGIAPSVALLNLVPGSNVGGIVPLTAVATDNVGVASVQFKANGVNIGPAVTVAPYMVGWNTAGLASGTYAITAVATDIFGNVATSASISVVVDATAPTVTNHTPATSATAVPTDTTPTVTFSESVQPSTISFILQDANGVIVPATIAYNDATKTVTLFPNTSLTLSGTYTATVSGARDLSGNQMAGSVIWSFTVDSHLTGAALWSDNVVPSIAAVPNDSSAIEVGVKFQSSVAGFITGLRFYKGAGNTGTHVGHLWSSTGALLATATFTSESATGWQTVDFATPVAISANTTYVASYVAPNGHYAFDSGFFSAGGVTSSPLRALANSEGGNGVFTYSPGSMPNSSYNAANYWVDVVFSSNAQDVSAPTVSAATPASGATGVSPSTAVSATFSEPVQASTISFVLKDASGATVASSFVYNSSTQTATLTPTAALASNASYTVTLSGAKDTSGNQMSSVTWSFTTSAPVSGSSIWSDGAVPAVAAVPNDSSAIEVGVKFQSSVAGFITGLRFYKGAGNTGTHVGHLWSASGALLATATFTSESDTGWQTISFSSPVAISANTTYVASYVAPNGHYAFNSGFFSSGGVTSSPLRALANSEGGNGVFTYSPGTMPNGTYNAANYWVDVVFTTNSQDTAAPVVVTMTPTGGATGVQTGTTVTAAFNEAINANSLSFVLKDANGVTVTAAVSYNSVTQTATLTPSSALATNTTYTATVSASDISGNAMLPVSWSFTTPTPATNLSLFGGAGTPSTMNDQDSNAIEVGVRFFSEVGGYISGLRFYKGPYATGTHVGHLWSNTGTLLATATFTGETGSGWQEVTFASPVAIDANTLYVASYYAPQGRYSATPGGFATSGVVNGSLHAPANGVNGGNGLYTYGTGGGFPTQSYNGTNYWVDVVFTQTTSDATAPTVTSVTPSNNATGVLSTAPISVTFSEAVNPQTINFVVKDPFNNVVTGNMQYNAATHVATFIPANPLASFTTYTVTIQGVKDLSGNDMASSYSWSFRTRGVWMQTTVGDFSGGTNDGTLVTNQSGGEVTLAPVLQEDFSAASLSSATWTTKSWASDGGGAQTVSLSGGALTLGGTAMLSVQSYTNTALEGQINFRAAPYQHFGLTTSFDSAGGNYWALFSTGGRSDTLYARVNANGTTTDVWLGALPTGFHTYRIQPTSTGFQFYLDGTLMTTINATFQNTVALRAGLSDFNGTAGQLIQADWIRFAGYSTTQSGTFTSVVFNAGQSVTWDTAHWTAYLPPNTSITVEVRVGDTSTPDSSWSGWTTVSNDQQMQGANQSALTGQYFQYRLVLTTTDGSSAPVLDDISFSWV